MAHDVTAAFIEQFESEVKHAYQGEGMSLRDTVRSKFGVRGKKVNFPIYGKGAARDRGASASDVPTMGTGATNEEVDLANKIAADFSDVFDEQGLAFEDRQELAAAIAFGMARCDDQMIIDALNTSGTTKTVPANYDDGVTDTGLSAKKVKRAARLLNDSGVPKKDRFFVYTPGGLDSLLQDLEVNSIDYNNVKPLVDGDVDTWMGFKFVEINDEDVVVEGGAHVITGLPGVGTTTRKYFAYHKKSIGYANGKDSSVMADWVPQKASYLVQSHLIAGAGKLDATGIVEVNVEES